MNQWNSSKNTFMTLSSFLFTRTLAITTHLSQFFLIKLCKAKIKFPYYKSLKNEFLLFFTTVQIHYFDNIKTTKQNLWSKKKQQIITCPQTPNNQNSLVFKLNSSTPSSSVTRLRHQHQPFKHTIAFLNSMSIPLFGTLWIGSLKTRFRKSSYCIQRTRKE